MDNIIQNFRNLEKSVFWMLVSWNLNFGFLQALCSTALKTDLILLIIKITIWALEIIVKEHSSPRHAQAQIKALSHKGEVICEHDSGAPPSSLGEVHSKWTEAKLNTGKLSCGQTNGKLSCGQANQWLRGTIWVVTSGQLKQNKKKHHF